MTNILVPKLFVLARIFVFAILAPLFSVGETLHIAYKKYKIKENLLFFFSVNIQYISSHELKTSEFSLVLRTHENSDVFKTLDETYFSRDT